jgi:hypothetical protein
MPSIDRSAATSSVGRSIDRIDRSGPPPGWAEGLVKGVLRCTESVQVVSAKEILAAAGLLNRLEPLLSLSFFVQLVSVVFGQGWASAEPAHLSAVLAQRGGPANGPLSKPSRSGALVWKSGDYDHR